MPGWAVGGWCAGESLLHQANCALLALASPRLLDAAAWVNWELLVGVEALVRWHHPERGLLYPDQFLPLARHNALAYAMTELVVQRALEDAAVWHARGHRVPVAVNLFPPTMADLDLPARLDDALGRQGLTSAALAVEITEDFLVGNPDQARVVLDGLHRLGITIVIDDFGSGNSSLNYLRHLPIDEVKLDRSFTASITEDPRVVAIVRSVIDLSHTLGLSTVAEGVENSATAAMLTGYGCDIAQGRHYSPPLTVPQILHLLAQLTDATERRERNALMDCDQARREAAAVAPGKLPAAGRGHR